MLAIFCRKKTTYFAQQVTKVYSRLWHDGSICIGPHGEVYTIRLIIVSYKHQTVWPSINVYPYMPHREQHKD